MKKKKAAPRKRPTVGEMRQLRRALRYARAEARKYSYAYQSAERQIIHANREIHDMKDTVAEAQRSQWRIINAFNAQKVGEWWRGAVRSRINGAIYFQPHDFAAHLTDNQCIVEREWLTDAMCNDLELATAGRESHG